MLSIFNYILHVSLFYAFPSGEIGFSEAKSTPQTRLLVWDSVTLRSHFQPTDFDLVELVEPLEQAGTC